MIIKGYGDIPPAYLPDVGEVVNARPSEAVPYLRAVVLGAQRQKNRRIKIKLEWLEGHDVPGATTKPIAAGTVQWIVLPDDVSAPPLVKRISRGDA